MNHTIAERLLTEHLAEGNLSPGNEIGLRIDQTLTQDATGTMVYLEFESMGLKRVKPQVAVSYVDHNIIQTDSRISETESNIAPESAAIEIAACFPSAMNSKETQV